MSLNIPVSALGCLDAYTSFRTHICGRHLGCDCVEKRLTLIQHCHDITPGKCSFVINNDSRNNIHLRLTGIWHILICYFPSESLFCISFILFDQKTLINSLRAETLGKTSMRIYMPRQSNDCLVLFLLGILEFMIKKITWSHIIVSIINADDSVRRELEHQ